MFAGLIVLRQLDFNYEENKTRLMMAGLCIGHEWERF